MVRILFSILCLILMAAFIVAEYREKWVAGVALKGAASLCFVILGILGSRGAADARFAGYVVAGLAVKLIFAAGTLVFLVGHVLYSVAVWPRAAIPWLFVIIGVVATLFIMRWIFSKIDAPGALKAIGVFYVGIVVVLNFLALSALFNNLGAQSLVFLLGTAFFLVSDIVLILNTFGGNPQFKRRMLNLTLYYIGQILIAQSLFLG